MVSSKASLAVFEHSGDDEIGGLLQLPGLFLCGYVRCDQAEDCEVAHSCLHGRGPHTIKVCITRKGNESVFSELLDRCPKPQRP